MTQLRKVALMSVLGVLLAVAAPGPAVAAMITPVVSSHTSSAGLPFAPRQPPPGPAIDQGQTEQAGNTKTKNNFIAAGAAVGLGLLVLWGRRVRRQKRHKIRNQGKE